MTDRNAIIDLRDVHKHYGEFHALKGISMEIAEGEFFSLLGPSGCGKTTLLRSIAGFEDISSGALMLDGADMAGVPPNKRPTNMVFQSYAIFPHLTVGENVAFGLRRKTGLSKSDKARMVDEALEMVGLVGYGARAAHALSGGQRQRVALARALILKPRVLLLDEPLSALDKKLREQMQSELRRLQRQVGITFILVTHDQEEALIMSDRIAVMFEGRIAQLASPQDLYLRPKSRDVAEFIGVMNFFEGGFQTGAAGIEMTAQGLGAARITGDQIMGSGSGTSCAVGIRPESLSILFEGETTSERIAEGVVDDLAYYGDMTYYEVRLDGMDHPLTISMKNRAGRPVLERGVRTRVAWDPRSLVVFS